MIGHVPVIGMPRRTWIAWLVADAPRRGRSFGGGHGEI